MKLRELLENINQPQTFNFGKIKVNTKPSMQRSDGPFVSGTDLSTSINSFKGHQFDGGALSGMAKYNQQTRNWLAEFHGSVEDNQGNAILLSGNGEGQTMELAIQNALKSFIQNGNQAFQ